MSALEKVREALEAHGSKIEGASPDRFLAQCPTHADGRPSLSVKRGDRGVLLYCFAGCDTKQIVRDLGLQDRDLFDSSEITYDYRDASGSLTRTVVRKPGKGFFQRGPNKKGTEGTSPLYRLEKVSEAVQSGTPVYFAEGEKDVHHLEAAGVVATCTAGGSSQAKFTNFSPLQGAEVRIIPDRDPEGLKYAKQVTELLSGVASSVTFWSVPEGKDFSDSWAAGFGVEDLQEFVPDFVQEADQGKEPEEEFHRRVVTAALAGVKPRPVSWLWQDRIPAGETTVLAGREGLGKSTLAAWVAAEVTKGTLEGNCSEPRDVLWITSEDSLSRVLVPRLTAAGADLERVHAVTVALSTGGEDSVILPVDTGELTEAAKRHGASLIVIDPLSSVLSQSLDTHKDHSLRAAMDPLRLMAEETGAAVLALHHLNKSKAGDLGDRMIGARTFAAAARSVLGVLEDPDDPEERQRILTLAKANLTDRSSVPGLVFVVESHSVSGEGGEITTGAVRMLGTSALSTSDLLASTDDPDNDHDEAVEWLRDFLIHQEGSSPRKDVLKAARGEGFSESSLKRAAKKLRVERKRQGFSGGSVWILPEFQVSPEAEEEPEEVPPENVQEFPLQAVLQETARECRVRNCSELEAVDVSLGGITWGVCEVHAAENLAIRSRGEGLEVVA